MGGKNPKQRSSSTKNICRFEGDKPYCPYCGLNVHVLLKFICWSPEPQCDSIWRWGLREVLRVRQGCEGRAFIKGLVSLKEGMPESLLALSPHVHKEGVTWAHSEMGTVCKPGRNFSPEPDCAGSLTSDFQALELWENKFLVFFDFFFFLLLLFMATPAAYGNFKDEGGIRAAAARIWAASVNYIAAHSNTGSLTHWVRPEIEPTSSWTLCWVLNPVNHNGNSQFLLFKPPV